MDSKISNNKWQERIKRLMVTDTEENPLNYNIIPKSVEMIEHVNLKPNPFSSVLNIEISCQYSKQVIVRMFNETGRIVKMFSWYLVKGINVTSLNDFKKDNSGYYLLDVIDHEGTVLYSSRIEKEQ